MKERRGIEIIFNGDYFITGGLGPIIGHELRIKVQKHPHVDYTKILKYISDYIINYKQTINSEQTIAYHSWLLKFVKSSDLFYDIWEANENGDGFVEGTDYSIKVLADQMEECIKYGVPPIFPTFSQKIVISKGVYEGLGVDAVRYPSPENMTGWWVTTDMYDDNIESLMNVHYFHVAFKRPDLIRYFALPFGYRFYVTENEKGVWFDAKVLNKK